MIANIKKFIIANKNILQFQNVLYLWGMTAREFELMAMIDYCYFEIGRIKERVFDKKHRLALDAMIDNATGYDEHAADKRALRYYLICLCRYKIEYGADYSHEYKFLQAIKATIHPDTITLKQNK